MATARINRDGTIEWNNDMSPDRTYSIPGATIEAHGFSLSDHTAIMRGELSLPHPIDGTCLTCRIEYERQLTLLDRRFGLQNLIQSSGRCWMPEIVKIGLRRLTEEHDG